VLKRADSSKGRAEGSVAPGQIACLHIHTVLKALHQSYTRVIRLQQ
jgi:hypothetical protein